MQGAGRLSKSFSFSWHALLCFHWEGACDFFGWNWFLDRIIFRMVHSWVKLPVHPFVSSKVEAYFMSCIVKSLLTWKAKRHIPSWKPKYNMMLDACRFSHMFSLLFVYHVDVFFGFHPVFSIFWMFWMRFPAGCADRRSLRLEGLRSSYVPWLKDAFKTFMATVPLTQMERQ